MFSMFGNRAIIYPLQNDTIFEFFRPSNQEILKIQQLRFFLTTKQHCFLIFIELKIVLCPDGYFEVSRVDFHSSLNISDEGSVIYHFVMFF